MAGETVVVGPEDVLPGGWAASVLLAGSGTARWHAEVVASLRRGWRGAGRLAVFAPSAEATPPSWVAARRDQADAVVFRVYGDGGAEVLEAVRQQGCGRGVVLLAPDASADLREFARGHGVECVAGADRAAEVVLAALAGGDPRDGVDAEVPLTLWRTPSFRHWARAQERAGNRVDHARAVWAMSASPGAGAFLWAVHPHVHVAGEGRVKSNEVVIGRTDVVAVVAYQPAGVLLQTRVVLVREFRSAAVTADGYVHELPGGSDPSARDLCAAAAAEFGTETGLAVDGGRLRAHGARQPVATLLAHRQHVFSVELSGAEMDGLADCTQVHGDAAEGERTTVEVATFGQIIDGGLTDWTTLGMIVAVLSAVPPVSAAAAS
ncbi:hypothetical protein Cs7R123_09010 [Catellatospora sp. TT07R-123]|uniref:hypothetical protein n=1 Tax=Catellatospora sp. TT07R-123 TaxID=2733863 RepID=UPI001AFF85EF|nr:hypothetical protein [Catellatospora sp. TT07R-123]GHJ43559.1 hypothetical protein Cs7R123_09010 [Catellatospora sp. TT07R-123]